MLEIIVLFYVGVIGGILAIYTVGFGVLIALINFRERFRK